MPVNFPSIIANYSLVFTPQFVTDIIKYSGRVEQRLAREANPQYRIRMRFSACIPADADTLLAFFIARKGTYEAFYLQNQAEAYRSTIWLAGHVYVAGDIVRPVTANGRSYKCTTAGTSHGSTEPTWPTTFHSTVNDNGLIWTENSYLVRFEVDMMDVEYFDYCFYDLGEITMIEVPA